MKVFKSVFVSCAVLLLYAASASATVVDYSATHLGGKTYELNFSIYNDGFSDPGIIPDQIQWFRVDLFPVTGFQNVQPGDTPGGWSAYSLSPLDPFPWSYYADTVDQGTFLPGMGVLFLDRLDGFKAVIDTAGPPDFSRMQFEVGNFGFYDDPDTGQRMYEADQMISLDTGTVTAAPVPEPATFVLCCIGLAGLVLIRRSAIWKSAPVRRA